MLCIDNKAIKSSLTIQKDIDLDSLLRKSTDYFCSREEAYEKGYSPLTFATSIRSIYSNLVLRKEVSEEEVLYYTVLGNVQPYIHKGADLIMYLTSLSVVSCFNYTPAFDLLMAKSTFSLMGFYNPEPLCIDPIVYSHVILSDNIIEDISYMLKPEYSFVPISEIGSIPTNCMTALTDTLINVRKEKDYGSNDDNEGI